MPILPASTVTRLSIRKQVRRCGAFALPLSSNELGKSWICKYRVKKVWAVQSAPSISDSQSSATSFVLSTRVSRDRIHHLPQFMNRVEVSVFALLS